MHLSVSKDSFITVIDSAGKATRSPVEGCSGDHEVYDWFGNRRKISIKSAGEESRWITLCSSGESMIFGDTHSVLCRKVTDGRWVRRPIGELSDKIYMVRLPQRKLTVPHGLFDAFDMDDAGVFLAPERASQFMSMMQKAAWVGAQVRRHKTELRVTLDERRPPCFITKLINGGFDEDLENTLSGLVASGVVFPPEMLTERYYQSIRDTGVFFEGATVLHDIPLFAPTKLEKPGPVYHIEIEDPSVPVELTWCHM